jgi:RNA polymerase sigma factor (sigma-70 family)
MVNGRTSGAIRQVVRAFREGTLSGLSDREILGRFVDDRDEAAFEALLTRHGPMVLNVCRQILRHPEDAEDAFQATFLALACKAGTLWIDESLGPWLYRVASRVAARARAERRRRGDRERSGGALPEPEPARGDGTDRDEIPRVVHEELGRLPERLRAPIVLCYLEGMTHEQAACHLGCPVGTVRSRMARARALLRGRIARRGLATTDAAPADVLATDARASAVPRHIPPTLIKSAAQIAAGTASLRGDAGIPTRVAALLEGVLKMFRIRQLASTMAALAVIGVAATIAGLSALPASGQADNLLGPRKIGVDSKPIGPPPVETYVKTYYVGDLLISDLLPRRPAPGTANGGRPRLLEMSPLIELITSTCAKGTWTIQDETGRPVVIVDGRLVETTNGAVTTTVGTITPFRLSISLIVRQIAEVHAEVARLLRNLRRWLYLREHPGGPDPDFGDQKAPGKAAPIVEQKPRSPGSGPTPDRNARIRHLLDELRKEVEALPLDRR